MDDRSSLHAKRIKEGLEQIARFRENSENAWSANFKIWKDRVRQSLAELFGDKHEYTTRFRGLSFWAMRMQLGEARWDRRDQELFDKHLFVAEQLLTDCLEEIGVAPPESQQLADKVPHSRVSPVTVNVTNVLSQNVEVQMVQLLAGLDNLGLSREKRAEAEKLARELENETRGEQRWPVLSKTLESLKGLGKTVYKEVAVPLLLEMLKKQAGV
jgi:hypothetical protein